MQGMLLVIFCTLIGLALWLARRSAAQSARIETLKKEVEEYAKSQQIMDRVRVMPGDVVRRRLQERTK